MSYWIDKGIDGFYLSGIEYLARKKSGSVAVCFYMSLFEMSYFGKAWVRKNQTSSLFHSMLVASMQLFPHGLFRTGHASWIFFVILGIMWILTWEKIQQLKSNRCERILKPKKFLAMQSSCKKKNPNFAFWS